MSIKRIIICGQGGSGKDFLASEFVKTGYKFPISYTTRPARSNETQGVDYNFISVNQFREFIKDDLMYEYVEYPNRGLESNETWYYGRTKRDFYNGNVMIMTPGGINQLSKEDREESFIVVLDIPEKIRKKRLNKRNDSDNTERRLKTDKEDFENFKDFDHKISDSNFYSSNIIMMIEKSFKSISQN